MVSWFAAIEATSARDITMALSPPPNDSNGNGNGTVRFNLQQYLTEMEQRLTKQIDSVKTYCPNDRRIGRLEGLMKWVVAGSIAVVGALFGMLAHIMSAPK